MNLFQIIFLIIILLLIGKMTLKFKHRQITGGFYALWTFFWLLIGLLIIKQDILSYLAIKFGIGRGSDLAIYISILLIFYFLFKLYMKMEQTEKKHTQLIRKISLNNAKKPKND